MISVFKKYKLEILQVFVFLKRAIMKLTQLNILLTENKYFP